MLGFLLVSGFTGSSLFDLLLLRDESTDSLEDFDEGGVTWPAILESQYGVMSRKYLWSR